MLSALSKIQINDLLMEREDCFVQVSEYEAMIEEILGQPYPMPAPLCPLPSQSKRVKPRKAPSKSKSVRRLRPDIENAYRISFTQHGTSGSCLQKAPRLVNEMMQNFLPDYKVTRIEAVWVDSVDDITLIDILYS